MSHWLVGNHILNFVAPAIGVSGLMALAEMWVRKQRRLPLVWAQAFASYFFIASAVLVIGLAIMERDGKMLTYVWMVVGVGSLAAWRTH